MRINSSHWWCFRMGWEEGERRTVSFVARLLRKGEFTERVLPEKKRGETVAHTYELLQVHCCFD